MKKFFRIVLIFIILIILIFAALVLSLRFVRNADKTAQMERIELLTETPFPSMSIPDTLLDDSLRLNQIRWLATHNSYHGKASLLQLVLLDLFQPGEVDKLKYSHSGFYSQLELGVRSFELDLRRYRSGSYECIHVPLVDNRGHSPVFKGALEEMKLWSDRHPEHIPVIVIMETKDDWRFLDPGLRKWSPEALAGVDKIISGVLGQKLITPDTIRGADGTVRGGLIDNGWPELGKSRGKFIFVFHENDADYFNGEYFDSSDRVSFFMADRDSPEASFILRNEPGSADIAELGKEGFIVRTRADADLEYSEERKRLAIASGAQIVSTDFPKGYASNEEYSLGSDELF